MFSPLPGARSWPAAALRLLQGCKGCFQRTPGAQLTVFDRETVKPSELTMSCGPGAECANPSADFVEAVLYAVVLFGALAIIETVKCAYEITGNAANAIKLDAFTNYAIDGLKSSDHELCPLQETMDNQCRFHGSVAGQMINFICPAGSW